MSIQALLNNPATASTVAQRIEAASTAELAEHVAAVVASLALHPRAEEIALWLAYASAHDAEALTYLATMSYALGFSPELSLATVMAELRDKVELDFATLDNFASLTETLFDPRDSLVERMDAVRQFVEDSNARQQTLAA